MADLFDRASDQEQWARELALERTRARVPAAGDWRSLSARCCLACGEPIPEARRRALAGVRLCVECQRHEEQQGRR